MGGPIYDNGLCALGGLGLLLSSIGSKWPQRMLAASVNIDSAVLRYSSEKHFSSVVYSRKFTNNDKKSFSIVERMAFNGDFIRCCYCYMIVTI